jgi:chromosome segregation ATPase
MISLEQVKLLEERVKKAVARIGALQREKSELRAKLGGYEKRISELEDLVSDVRDNQNEIEAGLLNALKQLDALEDEAATEESVTPPTEGSSEQANEQLDSGDADTSETTDPDAEASIDEEEESVEESELDIF